MKLKVTLKDPDAVYDAITEALEEELKDIPEDEAEAVREIRREKINNIASKWFEWGEYLTVEIDTEAETIAVLPAKS